MNWHDRFKLMKLELKLTNKDIAEITGNTPNSIKSVTQPKNEFPRALKLSIYIYERMSSENNKLRYQRPNAIRNSQKEVIKSSSGSLIPINLLIKGNKFKLDNEALTVRLHYNDWNRNFKPYLLTTTGLKLYDSDRMVEFIE